MKQIAVRVDKNTNPSHTLHEQMMALFSMRQVRMEAYDDYINRFNLRLQIMEIFGGEHMLCIPKLTLKNLNDESEDDVNAEKERFRDMCFLLRSDKICYGELLEDKKNEDTTGVMNAQIL